MVLKIKHFVVFITIGIVFSCRQDPAILSKIDGKLIPIDHTLPVTDAVETYITPYRNRINTVLDSMLAYAPKRITKVDGKYNTSAGNLMADIVLSEVNPVFKSRTGKEIDFVLLNHGGIRSIISAGKVTARTAYEVMPFENSIVVAELKGTSVLDMVSYLRASGRAHPVAGIQLILNKDNSLQSIKIKGKPFDINRSYQVATSNYLFSGGDNMVFFADALNVTDTDYLIRNAMIDYFKKTDTIVSVVDDRFIKLEQ